MKDKVELDFVGSVGLLLTKIYKKMSWPLIIIHWNIIYTCTYSVFRCSFAANMAFLLSEPEVSPTSPYTAVSLVYS